MTDATMGADPSGTVGSTAPASPLDAPDRLPHAAEPLLRIDDFTFRYRRATEPAIRDVSLTVDAGEIVLVAGPSGCGKSTLIRAINGLIPHAYPGELDRRRPRRGPADDAELQAARHRGDDRHRAAGPGQADRRARRSRPSWPSDRRTGASRARRSASGIREVVVAGRDRASARSRDRGAVGRRAPAPGRGRASSCCGRGSSSSTSRSPTSTRRPPSACWPCCARWPTRAARSSSSSTGSRRRSTCGPTASCTWKQGATRYIGGRGRVPRGRRSGVGQAAVRASSRRRVGTRAASATRAAAVGIADRARPTSTGAARARVPGRARAAIGGHEILHGVDAALGRRPRRVAILGPNGSGKTTLFRTAMRLLDVCRGRDPRRRRRRSPSARVDRAGRALRLRLPEPEPDALRPDGRGGDPVRADGTSGATRPASRSCSRMSLTRTSASPTSRTSASGRRWRCRSASRSGWRWPSPWPCGRRRSSSTSRPPGRTTAPRRVHARGRARSRDCEICTSSRTTWTLH